MVLFARLVFVSILMVGCSDDAAPVLDSGGGGDASNPGCPTYLPGADGACTQEGVTCRYGDNPSCLARASCTQSKWVVVIPTCSTNAACPQNRQEAAWKDCQVKDTRCDYVGLLCVCTNCSSYPLPQCSGPLQWRCEAPNADLDCPHAQPTVSTACAKEGQFCNYGCEHDVSRKCEAGKWATASAPGGCPRSTRRAKRSIRYIRAKDRARIAAQALDLKLATYRYRDPALDGRDHLGFILEDSPTCVAADRQKMQVDLYSYASMVLVLAQQQQRELSTLRRELTSLRAEVMRIRRMTRRK
jgi:hypothetical protein